MATAPECITRFEHEGVFAASPERIGRALRERATGSWPASPIGGGGASPHVTPTHLASFLIAQAGFVPSEAANALAALRELPLLDYDRFLLPLAGPDPHQVAPAATLRATVEAMIEAATDQAWREALKHWELTLCADNPAWAAMDSSHGIFHVARFAGFSFEHWRSGERVERIVSIPRPALLICGELWANSKAKLATKDENAAALPGATASSTAPTARQRQVPSSSDASVRVRAPATAGGPSHARRRRHSPLGTATGVP